MLPMNQKEFENWTKIRAQGAKKYSLKTSGFATIFVFLLTFFTNGYVHRENLNKYLGYNVNHWEKTAITLLITFVTLVVCAKILFYLNEKRYKATQDKK